jgi:hypothetical protein
MRDQALDGATHRPLGCRTAKPRFPTRILISRAGYGTRNGPRFSELNSSTSERAPAGPGTLVKVLGVALLVALSLLGYTILSDTGASTQAQDGPTITEFMAADEGTLADRDGEHSGWIEIYNRGPTAVDLGGWYLTDDLGQLAKWRFPATELLPNHYLVVFASGKDRAVAGQELHANFRLQNGGEFLALAKPDRQTIVSTYGPQYPPQFEGISYGLVAGSLPRYLTTPTPGKANGSATANLGPILSGVEHSPHVPTAEDDLTVRVAVQEAYAPIASVTLHLRVMYGPSQRYGRAHHPLAPLQ